MLHRDRAEWRQRLGLVQHPLGQIRMHPHALQLARAEWPALVPDRVRDAEPSEIVNETRATQRPQRVVRQPELRPGLGREIGNRLGMAERVRRLQIDEVRDRQERGVELLPGEDDCEGRLGLDHGVPGPDRIEV